ncbi:MAG: outer membrane lipoprotein-sorting protein [Verrucomicrobiales bacterium]|nr:outer membrane lipoprotein-sorting protein [Verrucomicrobiales bacterium]
MFRSLLSAVGVIVSLSVTAPVRADEEPTGDQILHLVRLSYKGQDYQLTGMLRNDRTGKKDAFTLTLQHQLIRFRFADPAEIVSLDLATTPASLTRVLPGSKTEVPLARYDEEVRGMVFNYEDLALRFLYWPNAKLIGTDRVKLAKCWKVRVVNPDGRTAYGTVDLWVHQGSGGIARMEAYDFKGKLVKRFEVISVQKHEGETILKEMRVEGIDPDSGKVTGRGYMKLDK